MTDLIKRDDALTLVEQWFDTDDYLYSTIINDITNLPAIDPAAIREAAWMEALDAAHDYTDWRGRNENYCIASNTYSQHPSGGMATRY